MIKFRNVLVVSIALAMVSSTASANLKPTEIPPVFEKLLNSPTLSNPAMIVIDGSTGETIYEKNIYAQRKPASVMKVLTAAMVLQYLDPLKVFTTEVSITPETNTLYIKGSLDPWIGTTHSVARKMNRASLTHMASNATNAVRSYNAGELVEYTVIYSGLYEQDVKNFKIYWAKRGFNPIFKAEKADQILIETTVPVVTETSPSVAKILDWMMLWSDNQLADRLARLSSQAAGEPFGILGVERIFKKLLAELQIDSSKLVVKDASGLSKSNKVTAKMIGELLYKLRKDPRFTGLYPVLPVSGVSGTLNERFIDTAPTAVGLVRAKTGSLNGTATLAGYVESSDREYVFVTLADQIPRGYTSLKKARAAIDKILGRIAAPNIPAEISPLPSGI
jgi:D-alanyl-D-alanine carboxypeptidase/D-alanyl-D-alanine-endopeptidase (penicillin-binding protein 4)